MNKHSNIEKELNEKGMIMYKCAGTSMNPLLRQNRDALIIEKSAGNHSKYDIVLYKVGEKLILHRIIKVLDNGYIIRGDNCIRKEYGITDKNIIGILKQVVRNGKTLDVNKGWPRFYAHIWVDLAPLKNAGIATKSFLWRVKHKLIK